MHENEWRENHVEEKLIGEKWFLNTLSSEKHETSSLVESEHPVAPSDPECTNTRDGPETTMVLGTPLPDVLMSTVAEGSICGQLAVA